MGKNLVIPVLRISALFIAAVATLYAFYDRYVGGSLGSSAETEGVSAIVTAVNDGDSVTIRIGRRTEKARLIGIDAPELGQKPWGQRSRRHLKKIVGTSSVRVTTDLEKRDKYGRLLVYLWTKEGRLINLEMVRDGYALLYTIPPNVAHADLLKEAQQEAREKRRGLWGKNGLQELPGEYRKRHPR